MRFTILSVEVIQTVEMVTARVRYVVLLRSTESTHCTMKREI